MNKPGVLRKNVLNGTVYDFFTQLFCLLNMFSLKNEECFLINSALNKCVMTTDVKKASLVL